MIMIANRGCRNKNVDKIDWSFNFNGHVLL